MIEAKLNGEYALRVLGVGVLMFGICLWSLYDGSKAWPQCNTALEQVRPLLLSTNLTAEAWLTRSDVGETTLDAIFKEQGYKTPDKLTRKLGELRLPANVDDRDNARAAQIGHVHELFDQPIYSEQDLRTQYIQALVTLLLGIWAFVVIGLKARKRFYMDENGVYGSGIGAAGLKFTDISQLDWSKWHDKGIIGIILKNGGKVVLDGWHYKGITTIVDELTRVRPDLTEGHNANSTPESGAVT